MATMATVWIGMPTPSTRDGSTSDTPSLPSVATSRSRSQERQEASSPAASCPTSQAPCSRRHCQRPVRTRSASPGRTVEARPLSAASRSSGKTGSPGASASTPRRAGMSSSTPRVTMPSREAVDAELGGTVRSDRLGGVAVVELAVVEDVAQRVNVARGKAVRGDGEIVGAHSLGRRPRHVVGHRGGVVGRRNLCRGGGRTTRSGRCAPSWRRGP